MRLTSGTLPLGIEDAALRRIVTDVLDRWPSAGVAVGVVGVDVGVGELAWFHGHGVADTRSREPIDEDTAFRVGSVTKTFTAVAVMQLWEHGLVDLDAPVADYLRAFRLVPARTGLGPVTLRHLLTHTAGIGYWPRPRDVLRPSLGAGVQATRPVGSAADYLRHRLRVEVEPGTKWMYSNHGFATLGQVVEDVTGEPFDRYLREHVFDPLGMTHTDLVLSDRVRARLATGYVLGRDGLEAVPWRDVPTPGGGGISSTMRDMAHYALALLGGGSHSAGSILRPETVAEMFRPHFRPDRRIPGMGLGFELGNEGGHRIVGKDGVVSGFLAQLVLAPDDGLGVIVLSNTGGLDARGAPTPIGLATMRHLLGLPDSPFRTDLAPRPEVWADLCGWYDLAPGPMTNLFLRLLMGAGVEVRVRRRQLFLQPLSPIPALRRGMRLHPDDPDDPYVFLIDMSEMGKPPMPVVFGGSSDSGGPAERLCFGESVFHRRPHARNPRILAAGVLGGGAGAVAARVAVSRRRRPLSSSPMFSASTADVTVTDAEDRAADLGSATRPPQ
jgi:CubicO group peptidase (beta-lactamase class C family)